MWLLQAILFGLSFSTLHGYDMTHRINIWDGRLPITCPPYSIVTHDGQTCLFRSHYDYCPEDSFWIRTAQHTGMIVYREQDNITKFAWEMAAIHLSCGQYSDEKFAFWYESSSKKHSFVHCGGGSREASDLNGKYHPVCSVKRWAPYNETTVSVAEVADDFHHYYVTYEAGGDNGIFPYSNKFVEAVNSKAVVSTSIRKEGDKLFSTNGYGVQGGGKYDKMVDKACLFAEGTCAGVTSKNKFQETARID
ncbi:unnamed protein product [Bursaphelenchus okinawaensis]|uniref:Uncharacterized protein n=1 Tax=Bursaphelenchus okinawaensis TaxID=465554 RepID=A0A811K0A5_9BILA|nr:unnamed protein product [Bursaphelenchus okinawaensis]CAG9088799.1 unnamed protein product [Bursaphelenchus okinawaensis]